VYVLHCAAFDATVPEVSTRTVCAPLGMPVPRKNIDSDVGSPVAFCCGEPDTSTIATPP